MKTVKLSIIASLLILAACSDPRLPDPGVNRPAPPAELMEPARKMNPVTPGETQFVSR